MKVLLRRGANAVERTPAEEPLASGDQNPRSAAVLDDVEGQERGVDGDGVHASSGARLPTGVVKTRDQLMSDAYPDRVSVSDRTIDSHVKRIRRKLQAVDPAFDRIEAVYGAGYRFLPQA